MKNKQKQKTNVNLENLKSNYFLEQIFIHIKKNRFLKLLKPNKILQKRLNLSLKDYKEYSLIYSPIEVELKVIDNKDGKFINIPNKEKEYYHIYFDDSKEEIKRNYLQKDEKIKTIKIIIDYQIKSLKGFLLIVNVLIQ